MLLRLWADGRGEVGTEWCFRLEPPGEDIRPLVPDVDGHARFIEGDAFPHQALPGLTFAAYEVFAVLNRPAKQRLELGSTIRIASACPLRA